MLRAFLALTAFLVLLCVQPAQAGRPRIGAPDPPVISNLTVTDTSISGQITACVDDGEPDPPGVCTQNVYAVPESGPGANSPPLNGGLWTVTGLDPATPYGVYGISDDGDGATASNVEIVTTAANPPPTPPPPPVLPDPQDMELDRSVSTRLREATAFLYEGMDPVQTGVAPGTIETLRAAVIRGRVLDRTGAPLPSVQVTVLDHPEYGETLTRADGFFDLAVNGGSTLTLLLTREGYVPIRRSAETAWEEYAALPDSVMVLRDPNVNVIDTASAEPFQVAQGTLYADALGERRPIVLFEQGTSANAIVGGFPQALTTLTTRITELTAGPTAIEALPAPIPPGVDPTYIFEFAVEEAEALGATSVTFDPPVRFYLDNLPGTAVGGSAAIAFFDTADNAWKPGAQGQVIQIISESGGEAQVDTTGNGTADNTGLTAAERTVLAELYEPGKDLRRYETDHFSYGCPHLKPLLPSDAAYPGQAAPRTGSGRDTCGATCPGSIIRSERQVWGESVEIVGTPYRLHYESDRVPGYAAARRLQIPLTGGSPPASLEEVRLDIRVAGRHFTETFGPGADQAFNFTDWDGTDAFGRSSRAASPCAWRSSTSTRGSRRVFVPSSR